MNPTPKIKKLKMPALAELVFDPAYLLFAIFAGIFMIIRSQGENLPLLLYGILAIVLGCGDAFHLLPRIYGHLFGMKSVTKQLGLGKLITSISMTAFYLLLYCVWALVYKQQIGSSLFFTLGALAILRIFLCLLPQNAWFQEESPVKWGIYRNIPFLMIGIIIIGLFYRTSWISQDGFCFMPLAIFLSFLFYIPVVLFSGKNPKIGALMLPKTAAYIWIICMGFQL